MGAPYPPAGPQMGYGQPPPMPGYGKVISKSFHCPICCYQVINSSWVPRWLWSTTKRWIRQSNAHATRHAARYADNLSP